MALLENSKLNNLLATFALISIPFTGVLRITEKLSLPILFFSILFFFNFNKIKFNNVNFILLLLLFIFGTIYLFLNQDIRAVVYHLTFFYSILIYFQGSKYILALGWNKIFRILFNICLISNIFIIYEFTTRNFLPEFFIDLFRNDSIDEYNPLFLKLFYRARGFAEESGHMGLFYEFSFPIILYYINYVKSIFKKLFFFITTFLAVFFIFSPLTIILILSSTLIWLFFINKNLASVLLFLIILFFLFFQYDLLDLIIYSLFEKLSFDSNSISVVDRLDRLNCVMDNFDNLLFGVGPFNFYKYCYFDTTLNLFFDILIYYGIIIFLITIIILIRILYISFKISKYSLLISFLFLLIHYQIITNFWYPFLFLTFGLIYFQQQISIEKK